MSARLPVLLALMLIAGPANGTAQQSLSSHTLAGTVTDAGGRPLAGAIIELSQAASTNSVRTIVTETDGKYRIEHILPGLYALTVRLAGYGAAIRDLEIGGGGEEFGFDIQLLPLRPEAGNAGPSASSSPDRGVVCGLTMITPRNPDRKMVAPSVPPAAAIPFSDRLMPPRMQDPPPAKCTMWSIQPTVCWDPVAPGR